MTSAWIVHLVRVGRIEFSPLSDHDKAKGMIKKIPVFLASNYNLCDMVLYILAVSLAFIFF